MTSRMSCPAEPVGDGAQDLAGLFTHLGKMPLIGAEQQLVLFIEHHHLDGGGTDVDTNTKAHKSPPYLIIIQITL